MAPGWAVSFPGCRTQVASMVGAKNRFVRGSTRKRNGAVSFFAQLETSRCVTGGGRDTIPRLRFPTLNDAMSVHRRMGWARIGANEDPEWGALLLPPLVHPIYLRRIRAPHIDGLSK